MNNEKKQHVRSYGIISLLVLVLASILICAPVWNGRTSDHQERTMHRAESLAYQLLESRKVNSSRGPASVAAPVNHLTLDHGEIGVDPWGHPFKFKLLKAKDHQISKIIVWSSGPNGTAETQSEVLESNREIRQPHFTGDDVGIMISVK
jgi:hypothetical protein